MKAVISRVLERRYAAITRRREDRLVDAFTRPARTLLSLGCAAGLLARRVGNRVGAACIVGIELDDTLIAEASGRGVIVLKHDLNHPLPFADNCFNAVCSDQVIEHLLNPDVFAAEIVRVLKPGGEAVIGTENLSSWHNVLALLLGYQAFAQSVSRRFHLGNPLSPHQGKRLQPHEKHETIFTQRGLLDLFRMNARQLEALRPLGFGHFPLPLWFDRIDSAHAYFIGVHLVKAHAPLR